MGKDLVFFLMVIYWTAVIAVVTRFRRQGIKGITLLISPAIPMLCALVGVGVAVYLTITEKSSLLSRPLAFIGYMVAATKMFPALLGIAARSIHQHQFKECKQPSAKKVKRRQTARWCLVERELRKPSYLTEVAQTIRSTPGLLPWAKLT